MFELNVSKINIFLKKVHKLASYNDWKTGKLYVKYLSSIINLNVLQNTNRNLKQNAHHKLIANSFVNSTSIVHTTNEQNSVFELIHCI